MNTRLTTFLALFAIVAFFSCSSEDDESRSRIIVTLTDSPGDYDAVNVDVRSVEVHQNSGNQESGWIELDNVNSKVYDLLKLTNGAEAVLSDTYYPSGRISQMRLVLGDNNSLEVDGETIPLTVPSGAQSGLELQINKNLDEGVVYNFQLDFDAAKSVVKSGNSGQYVLKPVIRVVTEATSGAITGHVLPSTENVVIYAMQDTDTVATSYAIADESGFLIKGVPAGSYNVVFDPGDSSEYAPLTIEDISVETGEVAEMDTVTLIK